MYFAQCRSRLEGWLLVQPFYVWHVLTLLVVTIVLACSFWVLFTISGIKNRLESAHRGLANQGKTLADLSKRHDQVQQQLASLNKQLYEYSERYCCSDRTDCIMKTIELCSSNAITIKNVTPIKESTKSWYSTTTISYGLEGQFKDLYRLLNKLSEHMLLTIKNISIRTATQGFLDVTCVCTYWHIKRDLYA